MREWVTVIRIDWHCVAVGWKWLVFFGAVDVSIILFGLVSEAAADMLYGAACGLMGSITLMPFMLSQQRGLDGLLALTPTSRRTIVLGHYSFAVSAIAAIVADLFVVGRVAQALGIHLAPLTSTIVPTIVMSVFFLVVTALQYPLLLRFGYDKMPIAGYLPLVIMMLGLFWFLDNGRPKQLVRDARFSVIAVLLALCIYGLSLLLSMRWYQRREL